MGKKISIEDIYEFIREKDITDSLISKEYINKMSLLTFECHLCGQEYLKSWDKFKQGQRCQNCAKKRIAKSNFLTIDYVRNYIKINGNGDFLLSSEYFGKKSKLQIFCHKHNGEYSISWDNFQTGRRCGICGDKNRGRVKSINASNFGNNLLDKYPEICLEWDFDKNYMGPETYPPKSTFCVYWICPKCGNSYYCKICGRTQEGQKCPLCPTRSSSSGEKEIQEWLLENNIEYLKQFSFDDCKYKKKLRFDFCVFINKIMFLIEYQGRQHYVPVDFFNKTNSDNRIKEFESNKERDGIKELYCKFKNIKLIIIPYWEKKNIRKILEKELNILTS